MNQALFSAQLNEVERLLRRLDLFEERGYNPQYPPSPAAFFRGKTYYEIWQLCFQERYFDFQLTDDSLLQFRVDSFEPLAFSYSYYECPLSPSISFDDYLRDYYEAEEEEIRRQSKRDFEEYFETGVPKAAVTPLRYDYSPTLYDEGRHPASHIHFGHRNNIRVGTKKVLRPLSFLCFVLRQAYPEIWVGFCGQTDCENIIRNVRDSLADVEVQYWNRRDEWEMLLI